jgi:hypothetical protein
MCWYDPPEGSKRLIKNCCQQIVDEIKECRKHDDPLGMYLDEVKDLLDNLYDPKSYLWTPHRSACFEYDPKCPECQAALHEKEE